MLYIPRLPPSKEERVILAIIRKAAKKAHAQRDTLTIKEILE